MIKQLQGLVDTVELNETGIIRKIKEEVTRQKRFQSSLLGKRTNTKVSDIDTKNYVKFLLKEGTLEEKREILNCFKSEVMLKNKAISLDSAE